MKIPWVVVAGWYHAVLLAALVWVAAWRPAWAPVVIAAAVVVHRPVSRTRVAEPWAGSLVALSSVAFLVLRAGWEVAVGWMLLAVVVAGVARALPRRDGGRPDAADCLGLGGWAAVFLIAPRLVAADQGGWLAPALLLLAAQRLVRVGSRPAPSPAPAPPSRGVRGTLSLDGVVVAGPDGLPASVPLDLELRAGDSLGILCDEPREAASLAEALTGRVAPLSGEVMVDGAPLEAGERMVAMVAPGEVFLPADLETNLGALAQETLDRGTLTAVHDACSLAEAAEAVGDRVIAADGTPLSPFHRLLVLVARVIPSSYRLLVVVDPMPWVDVVRGESWRAAIVRTSVGRTAIWITSDRDLAQRATHIMEYRQGALRPVT